LPNRRRDRDCLSATHKPAMRDHDPLAPRAQHHHPPSVQCGSRRDYEGVGGRGPLTTGLKAKGDKAIGAGRRAIQDYVPPPLVGPPSRRCEEARRTNHRHRTNIRTDQPPVNFYAQSTPRFPLQPGVAGRRLRRTTRPAASAEIPLSTPASARRIRECAPRPCAALPRTLSAV